MIVGESVHPTKKHLLELADYFQMKNAAAVIDEVQSVVQNWKIYAATCAVSDESKKSIQKVIEAKR